MSSPPKMITLNTPTIRDQRTLIWLQNQSVAVNWSKWDSIVTSLDSYHYWNSQQSHIVGFISTECTSNMDDWIQQLFQISKQIPMILLSQQILSCKSQEFWQENFDNLLNLDDLLQQYPFLKTPWNGTLSDAILIFALLCRYHRVIDCTNTTSRNLYNITLHNELRPSPVWLFTQYFKHPNKKRHQEIKECLRRNLECSSIDFIVLLNEKDMSNEWSSLPHSHKIKQFVIGKRLTYFSFLQYVHQQVPHNVITVLCNADIYMNDVSMNHLWKIKMEDRMLGLLRWDDTGSGASNATIFGPRADSQDTWIFLSDSIKNRLWNESDFNFQLGQPGCDNAFLGKLLRYRFLISNPSLSLKTFHLHNTNIRNYDKKDYIRSDIYVNLAPTYLIDTKQESTPSEKPLHLCNELVSFEIKSSSLSNEITYCTMLEKAGRYKWEAQVENHYFDPAIPVYSWKNASVTSNGLVYDLYHIYTGKYAIDNEQFNYWKNAPVDIFTPLQYRPRMFALPFPNNDVFKHLDVYVLQYLSRYIRLSGHYSETSFWFPSSFSSTMDSLEWKVDESLAVPVEDKIACWADEVVGFVPSPSTLELGREDITSLRSILPTWLSIPSCKICTIISDDHLNNELIEKIGGVLLGEDEEWSVRVVSSKESGNWDVLLGSSLCIFVGGKNKQTKWSKLWALPKDCCVVEFQQELDMDGEFQHLAHISDFKSWILLLSKGSVKDVQDQILTQFQKWWKKNNSELSS
jgi:hypothetical protein